MSISEIIETRDNKHLVDLKLASDEELQKLLKYFSEGSKELEICLNTLWKNKLYTKACCKGHLLEEKDWKFPYPNAYISMEDKVDVFSYLSVELIENPLILLYDFDRCQSIYFFGNDKEKYILKFAQDILSGKKDNEIYLNNKINKNMNLELRRKCYRDYYLKSGLNNDEIEKIDEINYQLYLLDAKNITIEDIQRQNELCEQYNQIINECKNRSIKSKKKCQVT